MRELRVRPSPFASLLRTPRLCVKKYQFSRCSLYMKSNMFKSLLTVVVLAISVSAQLKQPTESAMDRFMRYAKIDTQSAEDKETVPSTQKQFDLARLLEKELKVLGAQN